MRLIARVVAGLLLLIGTIWFLQGIGVLPGSFMSGQPRWAFNGAVAIAIGVILDYLVCSPSAVVMKLVLRDLQSVTSGVD